MALDGILPTGTEDWAGDDLMDEYKLEMERVWKYVPQPLTGVIGTNTIEAASVVPATAYFDGMKRRLVPIATNTISGVTIDIDGLGPKNLLDSEGVALAINALVIGSSYLVEYHTAGDAVRVIAGLRPPTAALNELPRGHLAGLFLSNNAGDATNDIDVSVGRTRSDDDAEDMTLGSGLVKRLDAVWAVGSNQGGLDAGVKTVSTKYAVWLIKRPDTQVVDVLFSLSATAPTMPANYTLKRRIGWVITDASNVIRPFKQLPDDPDWFVLLTGVAESSNDSPGTTRVLRTLTVPPSSIAWVSAYVFLNGTGNFCQVTINSPDETDVAASISNATMATSTALSGGEEAAAWQGFVPTNSSAQIAFRCGGDNPNQLRFRTHGWRDNRGKNL